MRRLYARIYLHFVGVLIVVALASSFIFATGFRNTLLHNWSVRLAQHAAWSVSRQPDSAARAQMLKHLSDELDIEVALRGTDGKVIASAGPLLPELSPEELFEAQQGPHLIHHGHDWMVAAPVRDTRTGALIGVLEARPMRRFAPWQVLRPLITVTVVLLIVGMATFPLARRISRPVERLTEASRRLGEGDLSYRVNLDDLEPRHRRWKRKWREARRGKHHRREPLDQLLELTRAWNDMADRVEKLVRGQRELMANVSHELRSPLARIRLALELLPDEASTAARRQDLAADLDELERLIDDVLTTSKLEATGLPTHVGKVKVADVYAQLAERAAHDPLTVGKPVTVHADGVGTLEADPALLKRALWNLVENAAKYGAPPIALEASRRGDRVELTVTDEGAGIPAGDRERVFDPFFRIDKARTPGAGETRGGYGLGLTLARRVAEVHGGSIRIDAAHPDGRGCKITLELPG
jgi:signal transduction histidine kinase